MPNKSKKKKTRPMSQYAVGLGVIFGAAIGTSFGVALDMNIALATGTGAGLGIVIGAMIASIGQKTDKEESHESD